METDVHFNQITDDCNLIADCIQTQARAKGLNPQQCKQLLEYYTTIMRKL